MKRNEKLFMEQIASRIWDNHPAWETTPDGFGFKIRIPDYGDGRMPLGDLFTRVQSQPDLAQDLIDDYLGEFEKAMRRREEVGF